MIRISAYAGRGQLSNGVRLAVAKGTLCLFLLVSLCACSTVVKVNETWEASDHPSATYVKILVAGITPSHNLRLSFETIFADTLNEHGVAAVASHTLISDLSKADQAHLQAVARQVGADAVIITRVLSHSEHTSYQLSTGHVELREVAETTTTGNSSTTIAMSGVGIVPGEMDSAGVTLETRLFDASNAKLIWTAMSSVAGDENARNKVCWEISALLTKALGKDKLVELNAKEFKMPHF